MEERWNAMNEKLKKGGKGMDEKGNLETETDSHTSAEYHLPRRQHGFSQRQKQTKRGHRRQTTHAHA